jgi:hypothetical protein
MHTYRELDNRRCKSCWTPFGSRTGQNLRGPEMKHARHSDADMDSDSKMKHTWHRDADMDSDSDTVEKDKHKHAVKGATRSDRANTEACGARLQNAGLSSESACNSAGCAQTKRTILLGSEASCKEKENDNVHEQTCSIKHDSICTAKNVHTCSKSWKEEGDMVSILDPTSANRNEHACSTPGDMYSHERESLVHGQLTLDRSKLVCSSEDVRDYRCSSCFDLRKIRDECSLKAAHSRRKLK